jgi:hypothetical protein
MILLLFEPSTETAEWQNEAQSHIQQASFVTSTAVSKITGYELEN